MYFLFQYICVIHFLFQATGARESKLAAKGFSHLVEVHFKNILTKCEPHDAADRDKDAARSLLDSLSGIKSQHLLS